MHAEFRAADSAKEIRALMAFDRKVFSPSDRFDSQTWRECHAFWLLVRGKRVGCCAFAENVDFTEDQSADGTNVPAPGSLYIMTTGILQEHRGKGLGSLMKAWQISYARCHGFAKLVTNMRQSNTAVIALNKKYGFKRKRISPRYYQDPDEPTIVMERRL
jgi:ribosomal protein S18 acetylase RimI-like enzyme